MKYDLLVSTLLEQSKKEYTVSCDRKRMTTQASSKEEAIRNVCWKMSNGNKNRFQELKKNAKVVNSIVIEGLYFGKDKKGNTTIGIKAPKGHDVFSVTTLKEVIKDIKKDKTKIWKHIKNNFNPNSLSPLVIALSIMIMGFNINKFPQLDPDTVNKAATILKLKPELKSLKNETL